MPLALGEYLKKMKNTKGIAILMIPLLALVVSASLLFSSGPENSLEIVSVENKKMITFSQGTGSFRDVSSQYPYKNAIAFAAEEGVINGFDNGTIFRPDDSVSRAELIKMLMYTYYSDDERNDCVSPYLRRGYDHVLFPDVPTRSWFASSACVAQKQGIIKGYSDGYLRPHLRVSFIEAAKIISKTFQLKEEKMTGDAWYLPSVRALADHGAIPKSIKSFDDEVTRGEIAEILYRLEKEMTGLPSKSEKSFPPIQAAPCDHCLIINRIGVTVPIVYGVGHESYADQNWNRLENDLLVGMRDGVVHYPDTAFPGYIGNVFLTGHSSYYTNDPGQYKDVFAQLAELEVGDEYVIYYYGNKYIYKVFEEKIIPPSDTSVLNPPTTKELSTLMTCWPVWTNINRKIFVSERVM